MIPSSLRIAAGVVTLAVAASASNAQGTVSLLDYKATIPALWV
jgi:hypothetical protein